MSTNTQNIDTKQLRARVIHLTPLITYKSTEIATQQQCYTFVVSERYANKDQIKLAFASQYGATALRVNTAPIRTKKKRNRYGYYQKNDQKKVYIWSDKALDIFPKL